MGSSIASCRAAGNIFARSGYRRASMSQIAEKAGLTRQALYHHYASKEALFRRGRRGSLHAFAYEAEAAAGLDQEKAGGGPCRYLWRRSRLFRYFPRMRRAVTAGRRTIIAKKHQLQTRDLYQSFIEHNADLRAETIDRACAKQGLALQNGMTSRDLAGVFRLRSADPQSAPVTPASCANSTGSFVCLWRARSRPLPSNPAPKGDRDEFSNDQWSHRNLARRSRSHLWSMSSATK